MSNEFQPATVYWATKPAAELAADLEQRYKGTDSSLESCGLREVWRKSYRYYYGRHWKAEQWGRAAGVLRLGKQGELSATTINNYRNLIKHVLVLTTNQKISWDVKATNSDSKSTVQARLGNGILDYYLRTKRLNRKFRGAAEQALVFAKGFNYVTWEPSAGRPIGTKVVEPAKSLPGGGPVAQAKGIEKVVHEGDVLCRTVSCFDHYSDDYEDDWDNRQWEMVRVFENKFDLAANYPQLADQLLKLPSLRELTPQRSEATQGQNVDTPKVPVYHFYHRPTPALPLGRYFSFCNSETVMYDSLERGNEMQYPSLPCFRIVPGEIFATTEGYSDAFDLLPLQEMQDVLHSTAYSNLSTFGLTRLLYPENCNLKVQTLAKGLVGLKYNPAAGMPTAFQPPMVPAELFSYFGMIDRMMETLSGVNSVARGNVGENLGKGTAAQTVNMVQSLAVQFSSLFQESYAMQAEDVGTFILRLLKKFANTPRMIAIAGEANEGYMQEFVGADIGDVDRAVVDLGNPMLRTYAGKKDLADMMLERGMIKTPAEYTTTLSSGTVDPILEAPQAAVTLIRREREMMLKGQMPPTLWTDPHLMHMREHLTLLDNPMVRSNDALVQLVLAHIQRHNTIYLNMAMNPQQAQMYSLITGEPPPPPPPMPPPPPGEEPHEEESEEPPPQQA